MTKKLILFDFDGTLVDSEAINILSLSRTVTSFGYKGYDFDNIYTRFVGLSADSIASALLEDNILEIDQIIAESNELAVKLARTQLNAMPKAIETLGVLNVPFCIASNGVRSMILEYLRFTKLIKFFDKKHIFTSSDVKRPKPFPDLFLYAAERMGNYDKSDCLVIEDSVVGVSAAKAANIDVLGFAPNIHPEQKNEKEKELKAAGAVHVINCLSEILKYL